MAFLRKGLPFEIKIPNDEELGKLNLTDDQIDAIVEFMKTLTDGYQLPGE